MFCGIRRPSLPRSFLEKENTMRTMLYATVAALALIVPPALNLAGPAAAQRPTAPQNRVYYVYYYNVRYPNRVHLWDSYTNYASALRAMNFVNSYPQYRAYIR
jgi:hypothetical protein